MVVGISTVVIAYVHDNLLCFDCVFDMLFGVCLLFFFQAEDGIRDLVRSRGLGDVYKRQLLPAAFSGQPRDHHPDVLRWHRPVRVGCEAGPGPVSYTHLTLPTSDLV